MRLRLPHFLMACVALCIVFAGCRESGSQSTAAYTPENSVEGIGAQQPIPDTMPEDMKPEPEKEAEAAKPQLQFASVQEALDYMYASPDADKYAEGILPQMAEDELSYAAKLLNSDYDKFLIIDKQLMRVGLFDRYGREILSYGIACARNYGTKHKRADSRTPEGFFSVEGIYNSTDWLFTNDQGYTSPAKGQFGPRFIRIKNPVSASIGLHGTASPGSIGRRASHGCIRVKNENILELVGFVTPGMPVIISPGKRDQQVNEREGYHVPMITMDPFGKYDDSATAQPKEDKPVSQPKRKSQVSDTVPDVEETPGTEVPATPEPEPAPEPAEAASV